LIFIHYHHISLDSYHMPRASKVLSNHDLPAPLGTWSF